MGNENNTNDEVADAASMMNDAISDDVNPTEEPADSASEAETAEELAGGEGAGEGEAEEDSSDTELEKHAHDLLDQGIDPVQAIMLGGAIMENIAQQQGGPVDLESMAGAAGGAPAGAPAGIQGIPGM